MQSSVSKTINQRMNNTLNHTAQPAHDYTESGAEIPDIEITDNFFMPKKQILRSDGASLSDIYSSKKEDSWGKILKAQIAEEVSRLLLCIDIAGVSRNTAYSIHSCVNMLPLPKLLVCCSLRV
jgi:hypothetical protein